MTREPDEDRGERAAEKVEVLPQRRCVIVAGMHRSGTSALTRVLSFCGLRLPAHLVAANSGNVRGHWESEPICQFNDRLLSRMGLHWISWQNSTTIQHDLPEKAALLEEAADLLRTEFGTENDFVLKDPRICRLIPFWRQVFAANRIDARFVLAYRHPSAVGRSIEARNGILPAYGHLAWLRFMLDAERETRGFLRMTFSFDGLIEDRSRSIDAIAAFIAQARARTFEIDQPAIDAFLSEDLRHFAEVEQQLPPWITQAIEVFERWAGSAEEHREDYAVLDGIAAALNAAEPVFAQLVEPTDRIRQLEAELFAAHNRIVECEVQLERHVPILTGRG